MKKIPIIILFFIIIPIFTNCNADMYPYYMEEEIVHPLEGIIPCIAVIDEDSSFSNCNGCSDQATMWNQFRNRYPDRPFCLLVIQEILTTLNPPNNFINDPNVIWHYPVARDNGDTMSAENWATLCDLNSYTSEDIPSVGLFVDNSGSTNIIDVSASYDKFVTHMKAKGIRVKEVFNTQENWILPFMTSLAR